MADLHANVSAAITKATENPSQNAPAKTSEPAPTPAQTAKAEGLKEALGVKEKPAPKEKAPVKEQKAPPAEPPRKHKLKVDNEELEVDEDELKRGYTHRKAADKRFEEAAAMRKQAEQAFEMLKDPAQLRKLLEDPRVGVDFRKVAEDYLWEKIQDENLTPEQKKQKEIERELEKYRAAEKEAKERAESQEQERLQNQYAAEYEQKIIAALDEGGIPKNRDSVRRMARYLQLALANNIDVSPKDLVERVKADLIEEHRSLYATGDGATLLSILGDDLAKKIREADLKRLKSTQPASQQRAPSQAKPVKQKEKPRQRISADVIAEALREKLGKG